MLETRESAEMAPLQDLKFCNLAIFKFGQPVLHVRSGSSVSDRCQD